MRRLDFVIVSQAMNDSKPRGAGVTQDQHNQWCNDCESLADAFQMQSPAFDRGRFLNDCGHTPRPTKSAEWTGPLPRS